MFVDAYSRLRTKCGPCSVVVEAAPDRIAPPRARRPDLPRQSTGGGDQPLRRDPAPASARQGRSPAGRCAASPPGARIARRSEGRQQVSGPAETCSNKHLRCSSRNNTRSGGRRGERPPIEQVVDGAPRAAPRGLSGRGDSVLAENVVQAGQGRSRTSKIIDALDAAPFRMLGPSRFRSFVEEVGTEQDPVKRRTAREQVCYPPWDARHRQRPDSTTPCNAELMGESEMLGDTRRPATASRVRSRQDAVRIATGQIVATMHRSRRTGPASCRRVHRVW
jgi:hypothetical protein